MMDESGDYTIDKTTISSLSSDTRILILLSLNERKKTNAELAKELSLKPPTIHHHIELLKKANLITANGDDHKWVYYDLTQFGRALLIPEKKMKVSILLSSVLVFCMAFAVVYTYFTIPSLNLRPWIPLAGDPFLLLFIIVVVAVIAQAVILFFTMRPVRK